MARLDPDDLPDDPVERNRLLNTVPRQSPGRPDLGSDRFWCYLLTAVVAIVVPTLVLVWTLAV